MTNVIAKARGLLRTRAHSYRSTFLNPEGEQVLRDLARFCRAHESTGHVDPYMASKLDGRREVWLRIQQHLNLSDEDLWQLFTNKGG